MMGSNPSLSADMDERAYWEHHWQHSRTLPPNDFAKRASTLLKKQHKTLLDLGCGDGRDALYFARKGLRVTALDFSRSGVARLKERNEDIRCVLGDIQKAKFKPRSFDVIYAHLSLHYFDDRTTRRIFRELHEILTSGGLLFVKCKSTDDALFGKGKKFAENVYRKGHTRHFFSKAYMADLLKDFHILSLRKTSSTYHAYKSSYIEAVAKKS